MNMPFDWKQIKKIRNKRTGKMRYICGSILSAIGLIRIMDFVEFPYPWHADSLIIGGILLLLGVAVVIATWRKVDKWNRYEAFINNRGNTSISFLAKALGEKEEDVCATLQQMINEHFFLGPESNVEAYIDGPRNLLVMTVDGKPLEPIEETVRRMKAAEPKPEPALAPAPVRTASPQSQNVELLRKAIETTEDKVVKASLYDLEGSVRRIEQKLASEPELAENQNIRNLQRHYLPMTMDLVKKYMEERNSPQTMELIGQALGTCADAFTSIERKLTERDDMSTEADILTLQSMFAQDGLLQTMGKPPAKQQPAKQTVQVSH